MWMVEFSYKNVNAVVGVVDKQISTKPALNVETRPVSLTTIRL